MKEYKNVKEYQSNEFSPKYYDAELWIDGKFIQNVTLSEVNYKYNVLLNKLASMVDEETLNGETLKEIEDVMQLKYDEGIEDGLDSY